MNVPLRVLIVEDSEDDAVLMARELKQGGLEPDIERVDTSEAMRKALENENWDLVLADYNLPKFNAVAALALVQEVGIDLPFVIVSGTIGEETAVAAMKAGAHDYLMKDNLARLAPAVERELREAEIRKARREAEMALRESEERYRSIFEGVRDSIFVESMTGEILDVNAQACEMFGWSREEFLAKSAKELVPEGQLVVAPSDMTAENIPTQPVETVNVRATGEHFPVEITTQIQTINNEKVLLAVVRDITRRKHDEERIKRQLQRLDALRKIDLAITASLDPRVTFNVLLEQVTTQLEIDAADILVFDRHTRTLNFSEGRGFRTEALKHTNLKLGEGHAGQAALDRRIVSIPDLSKSKNGLSRAPKLGSEGFVSYYAVPLIAKGTIQGVLEIFNRSHLDPDQEWLDFLDALSGQAAIAIDNSMLFDELQRSNVDLLLAYETTLEGWVAAIDLRDKETEGHTQRVTERTIRLAKQMEVGARELVHVRRGALLHDIGKMGIPDNILHKPGPLTEDEWEIMRQHPEFAHQWLSPIEFLRPALDIPYCHHEKWDGTGYPRGISTAEIPLAARIFAVVDVWDALLSDRPYREAWSEEETLTHIREQSGTHFDPDVVEVFMKMLADLRST